MKCLSWIVEKSGSEGSSRKVRMHRAMSPDVRRSWKVMIAQMVSSLRPGTIQIHQGLDTFAWYVCLSRTSVLRLTRSKGIALDPKRSKEDTRMCQTGRLETIVEACRRSSNHATCMSSPEATIDGGFADQNLPQESEMRSRTKEESMRKIAITSRTVLVYLAKGHNY